MESSGSKPCVQIVGGTNRPPNENWPAETWYTIVVCTIVLLVCVIFLVYWICHSWRKFERLYRVWGEDQENLVPALPNPAPLAQISTGNRGNRASASVAEHNPTPPRRVNSHPIESKKAKE